VRIVIANRLNDRDIRIMELYGELLIEKWGGERPPTDHGSNSRNSDKIGGMPSGK